jgi:hypothetical protein
VTPPAVRRAVAREARPDARSSKTTPESTPGQRRLEVDRPLPPGCTEIGCRTHMSTPAASGSVQTSDAVSLTLTPEQVEQVARIASTRGAEVLSIRRHLDIKLLAELNRQGNLSIPTASGSILRGMLVLATVPVEQPVRVIDVARALRMPSPTVHRYLHTWLLLGLLEQDPDTRAYRRIP